MENTMKNTTPEKLPAIDELFCDAITSVPQHFDWMFEGAQTFNDKGEDLPQGQYRFIEAVRCEKCTDILVFFMNTTNEKHDDFFDESGCDGCIPSVEGPEMNCWWYPFGRVPDDFDPEAAAQAIIDTPLCVVQVGDEYGLALTDGGMDMTWSICEAFMRAGYLPPSHFARQLPAEASRHTPVRAWISAGCKKSLTVHMGWLRGGMARIKSTVSREREYTGKLEAR